MRLRKLLSVLLVLVMLLSLTACGEGHSILDFLHRGEESSEENVTETAAPAEEKEESPAEAPAEPSADVPADSPDDTPDDDAEDAGGFRKEGGTPAGPDDDSMSFPVFEGWDLDGNPVDNSLFADNAVTVVNFWFSTCPPCLAELGLLGELNDTLRDMGGEVIGINTDTIDGDPEWIEEARTILETKGADYRNIWIMSDSVLNDFIFSEIIGFPTTYVVDRQGHIAGEPILGGIDYPELNDILWEQINDVLSRDAGE